MGEILSSQRKEDLKGILLRIHAEEDPQTIKEEFQKAVESITPLEIAQIEEELVREGIPRRTSKNFAISTSPSFGNPRRGKRPDARLASHRYTHGRAPRTFAHRGTPQPSSAHK